MWSLKHSSTIWDHTQFWAILTSCHLSLFIRTYFNSVYLGPFTLWGIHDDNIICLIHLVKCGLIKAMQRFWGASMATATFGSLKWSPSYADPSSTDSKPHDLRWIAR